MANAKISNCTVNIVEAATNSRPYLINAFLQHKFNFDWPRYTLISHVLYGK